ncbi:indole-3-glycerol phosphate synthase TrpC [Desulfurispira natronophila]|uniref:indole-3-glycerol-phosphate synthase n=1 Tax=Desulfurispira natronophila TaxID=682562 RepID=A0A7W7Y5D8_9BACT|nr:indole-3-glycerol phosphate synthase TrpC [Desulfurispira natronophila]MBB5022122.1 indole-3-glycerol phosphate synthase [Desulfurispira natronophila]
MLKTILEHKQREVQERKSQLPRWKEQAQHRDYRSLVKAMEHGDVAVLAEIKRASPSKGLICHDFDPQVIATEYVVGGAAAISVLTDEKFFQGHGEYLKQVRQRVDIPLLRKDFIVHDSQLYEAAALGADAVLLIGEALSESQAAELTALAGEIGLEILFEVHHADQLVKLPPDFSGLLGVNNRDLSTFQVDLQTSVNIARQAKRPVVCESGIGGRDDIVAMTRQGIRMFLIGEYLMRQEDRSAALRELRG